MFPAKPTIVSALVLMCAYGALFAHYRPFDPVQPITSHMQLIQPVFARAYNSWAKINSAAKPDVISAQEFLAWQDVKHEWRVLERQMDARYDGRK